MKDCVECGKNLGILEGYRHPTKGKENLVCSTCFDMVSASVEKWNDCISPYIGFFNHESSTIDDLHKIGEYIMKKIRNIQNKVNTLWFHNTNQPTQIDFSITN